MTRYKVQGMTSEAYNLMMTGCHGWTPREFWIEANSKEEAYKIAVEQYPDLVINDYVESEEEINEHSAKVQAMREEAQRKEKEKAERKAKREEEKAKEMGLTLEEYKEYKRLERNKKRHESDLKSCYAIIEKKKQEIKYEEKKIKEYEEKMKKIAERG